MSDKNSHIFKCVTCGDCCKKRFVPLTFNEAKAWLERGHQVSILLEAFAAGAQLENQSRQEYNMRRGVKSKSGDLDIYLIAIFAGRAIAKCPNLGLDNLCNIYEQRPLVCRVYPFEISPFIPLKKEEKDCPSDAWDQNAADLDDQLSQTLQSFIDASRIADQSDAAAKISVCEKLGYSVTAWQGDGYVIYTPAPFELRAAIENMTTNNACEYKWKIRVCSDVLRKKLICARALLYSRTNDQHIFHQR